MEERDEVCRIYDLDPDVVQDYVQFGEVFNLLHAGASYLRIHQSGFGAVGVSTKYGKRSYARYPIFWGLSGIGGLPNPDPSDLAAWSRSDIPTSSSEVAVNRESEAGRGFQREEAQRWANLTVDASAELFVFVGRWSMQKGVDLIADVFPTVLEKHPRTQLICVGPVIDLYGRFAAIKLAEMVKKYPGRVYSNPEFTALPPYIFAGAEFALIPSRDEPFGLVAVEFGRKGALGVGARVGGLGQMPGWWYTIESTSTQHLLQQFKGAIEGGLASETHTRAILRARSGQQRFPVAQWVQDLEILQSSAIKHHQKHAKKDNSSYRKWMVSNIAPPPEKQSPNPGRGQGVVGELRPPAFTNASALHSTHGNLQRRDEVEDTATSVATPTRPVTLATLSGPGELDWPSLSYIQDMGTRMGPGHRLDSEPAELEGENIVEGMISSWDGEYFWNSQSIIGSAVAGDDDRSYWQSRLSVRADTFDGTALHETALHSRPPTPELVMPQAPSMQDFPTPTMVVRSEDESRSPPVATSRPQDATDSPSEHAAYPSMLSSDAVVGEKKDFNLQKVDPFFTDPERDYETAFVRELKDLNGKSTYNTIIEEFIVKSEKDWFNRLRSVKMGKTKTPIGSIFHDKTGHSPALSVYGESRTDLPGSDDGQMQRQFLLADDYKPPTGARKLLLHRLGDWPVYSLLLAFVSCGTYVAVVLPLYLSYAVECSSGLTELRDKSSRPTRIRSHS